MAVLYSEHFVQFLDNNGDPLSGGKLYTYEAGTTTPKASYTDETAGTANANPVILDSAGRATVFVDGTYKYTLHDANDVLVRETDNVTSFSTSTTVNIDGQTEDTVALADFIVFSDTSDGGTTKKDDVQGLIDLVGGGGSGITLLGTATASASTSIDIHSGGDIDATIDSTYEQYLLIFSNVHSTVDGDELYYRSSSDGGSTFDSGATDYKYYNFHGVSGSAITDIDDTGQAFVELNRNIGNAAGESASGYLYLHSPAATDSFTKVNYFTAIDQSSGQFGVTFGGAARQSAADVDGIRIYMPGGNIASGEFKFYGIKKS